MTHDLKCHPAPFAAVSDGTKTFEVRWERERHYEVGDVLKLREYDPTSGLKHVPLCEQCKKPATHGQHWHNDYRWWCSSCVPMSGHYEHCPNPCTKVMKIKGYTGAVIERRVTYVLRGPSFEGSVPDGVVVLGLAVIL